MDTDRLTRDWLAGMGYINAKVEHYNAYTRRRNDLWGFDRIAFQPSVDGVLLVQNTTHEHAKERLAKVRANKEAMAWLSQPRRFGVVLGWRKIKDGKRSRAVPTILNCKPGGHESAD